MLDLARGGLGEDAFDDAVAEEAREGFGVDGAAGVLCEGGEGRAAGGRNVCGDVVACEGEEAGYVAGLKVFVN